jgi:predicted phosphodiesterase
MSAAKGSISWTNMRIAALYDIHGNTHALEAALAELEETNCDLVVVGGDVAGGPFPLETVERLMELSLPVRFVMGNGDREVIAAFGEDDFHGDDPARMTAIWCARQLSQQHIDFLKAFQPLVEVEIDGGRTALFCHGSPRSDEDVITPATPTARIEPMLASVTAHIVVCGHTHMQFDRKVGGVRVVNAGSIGMPYERGPGAYWAVAGDTIQLKRTLYDFNSAATAIRATSWPLAADFADENVLSVPAPEEAIAAFEPDETEER